MSIGLVGFGARRLSDDECWPWLIVISEKYALFSLSCAVCSSLRLCVSDAMLLLQVDMIGDR